MGVLGLWKLLAPCGHQIPIEVLAGKKLAVDVSIWLVQFIKSMRDENGNAVPNAHLIGTFSRLCKLLFYDIRPVFVFDGAAPYLKRQTIMKRRNARDKVENNLRVAANKLLLNKLSLATLATIKSGTEQVVDAALHNKSEEVLSEIADSESDEYSSPKILSGFYNEENEKESKISHLQSEILRLHSSIEEQRQENRPEFIETAKRGPSDFSNLQIASFLKSSEINREISRIKSEITDSLTNSINDDYNLPTKTTASGGEYIFQNVITSFEDPKFTTRKKRKVKSFVSENITSNKRHLPHAVQSKFSSWECSKCHHPNLAKQSECFLCKTPNEKAPNDIPIHQSSDFLFTDELEIETVCEVQEEKFQSEKIIMNPNSSIPVSVIPGKDSFRNDCVIQQSDISEECEAPLSIDNEIFQNETIENAKNVINSQEEIPLVNNSADYVGKNNFSSFKNHSSIAESNSSVNTLETDQIGWNCPLCLFFNNYLSPSCEICSTMQKLVGDDDEPENEFIAKPSLFKSLDDRALNLRNTRQNFFELVKNQSGISFDYELQPAKSAISETREPDLIITNEHSSTNNHSVNVASPNFDAPKSTSALTASFLEQENAELEESVKSLQRGQESVTDDMIEDMKELLTLFGVPYVFSPGEAEAQCSKLESMGLVDGIITDDSDAFLFGGTEVYKNIFESNKYVERYKIAEIKSDLGLSREKLIYLAMCLGSDYTEGIKGVGIVNAMEIISVYPDYDSLAEFRNWVFSNELITSVSKDSTLKDKFKYKHRNIRHKWGIDMTFPSSAVLNAYLNPNVIEENTQFEWAAPNTSLIREFCLKKFEMSESRINNSLVPLEEKLSKAGSNKVQTRIQSFFDFDSKAGKIRSARLQESITELSSKPLDENMVDPISKKSKNRKKTKENKE